MNNLARLNNGFTLLEIMIVVVILSLLVGMLAPNILGRVDEARVATAKSDISTLMQALELYKLDNYTYPSTQEGLEALISAPSALQESKKGREGGYLTRSELPRDPWDGAYFYLSPGEHGPFDLYSLGADGLEGGENFAADIGSWNL
ncbi:MAG: type II secretion system major pseudopilin GspG [Halioglobus sp.]